MNRALLGVLVVAILLISGCSDRDPLPGADSGAPDQGTTTDTLPWPDKTPASDKLPWRPDGPSTMGKACTADSACSAGLVCDTSMPDGLCTKTCQADTECGAGYGCVDSKCMPGCNVRAPVNDCRNKYKCQLLAGKSRCAADCNESGTCKTGLSCDKKSGLCLSPKGGTLGAACGVSIGDCSGTPNGVCLAVISMVKPYCTVPCSPFAGDCPSDVPGAYCTAGSLKGEYCVFYCDSKKKEKCPHTKMQCKQLSKYELCIPQ